MINRFFLVFIFTSIFSFSLSANEIHFLPKDSKEVQGKIINLIKESKHTIKIAMYNFSYKKIAKQLKKSRKNGVDITVVLDKSKVKKDDEIYKYLKSNGIKVIVPKDKLHTKIAVFDDSTALIGSMNWTKDSFKKNYEVVLFTQDKNIISSINSFINEL